MTHLSHRLCCPNRFVTAKYAPLRGLITTSGMIQAITNRQIGLKLAFSPYFAIDDAHRLSSVISELIVGFMLPGRPIALMM